MKILKHLATFSKILNGPQSHQAIFTKIYKKNSWGSAESVSGSGSTLEQTATIRVEIPKLLHQLNIKTLLDAPCGDLHWIQTIDLSMLDLYIGIDIVQELVATHRNTYANSKKTFELANIINDDLPRADLILCRDCLVHLCYKDIFSTLYNFRRSGAQYLLTTTHTNQASNKDINTGEWRPLNLQQPPFYFPKPLIIINEGCTEFNGAACDKSLALWRLEDVSAISAKAIV